MNESTAGTLDLRSDEKWTGGFWSTYLKAENSPEKQHREEMIFIHMCVLVSLASMVSTVG